MVTASIYPQTEEKEEYKKPLMFVCGEKDGNQASTYLQIDV